MRKIMLIILLCFTGTTAYASYTSVLHSELKNDDTLFFAYIADFESGERLITVADDGWRLRMRALDETDGTAVTDELDIVTGGGNVYRLSAVHDAEQDYILLETNGAGELYTVADDKFVRAEMREYTVDTLIAENRDGMTGTAGNTRADAYKLLNDMKSEQVKEYHFDNRLDDMPYSEQMKLRLIIAAAADIMNYDSAETNIDRLMVYVLNTYENFRFLSNVSPGEYSGNEVGLVSVEYIDAIMREYFRIDPPRPPVNELTSRGYCVNNGYYNYMKAFNVNFSTEIGDIEAVYDAGNGLDFVVFRDIYTENGVSVPEYSYMLLRRQDGGYTIEQISMGGELPEEHEIMERAGTEQVAKEDYDASVIKWVLLGAVLFMLIAVIYRAMRRHGK